MGCPAEETFVDFARGALDAEASTRLEAHVDACGACRELLVAVARSSLVRERGSAVTRAEGEKAPREEPTRIEAPGGRPAGSGDTARNEPAANDDDLTEGERFGRYVVRAPLGEGGMGVVFRASDPELGRDVALKVLRADTAASLRGARERLAQEARALARIGHPNVLAVYDVVVERGRLGLVLELADGGNLREKMRAGAPRAELLRLLLAAGRGLHAAHGANIAHRDFKPENVLLDASGGAKVADFGLARLSPRPVSDEAESASDDAPITRAGTIMGTLGYMAPEQLRGDPADARSDQLAFAVTLHEALVGRRPVAARERDELLACFASGRVVPDPQLPRRLAEPLRRALANEPSARHPSLEPLLVAIERELAPRRRWPMVAAGAALVGATGITFVARSGSGDPCAHAADASERVWPAQRRATLTAVGERTGASADRVASALAAIDERVATWSRLRTSTCTAFQRGERTATEHDRATSCLDRRLAEIDALASSWEGAAAPFESGARGAVLALAPLDRCTDPALLARPVEPPAAATPEAMRAIEARLADADAAYAAGRDREGIDASKAALEAARNVGDEWLASEAWTQLGRGYVHRVEPAAAEDAYRSAVRAATASRRDEVHARASVGLLETVGLLRARYEDGRALIPDVEASIRRLSSDPDGLTIMLEAVVGQLDLAQGRHAEATARLDRAATDLEAKVGASDLRLVELWLVTSRAHLERAELDRAAAYADRALALATAELSPSHPTVLDAHVELAGIAWARGRLEEALARFLAAFDASRGRLGDEHPEVARIEANIGVVLSDLERWDEAAVRLASARTRFAAALGADHPETTRVVYNVGVVEVERGNLVTGLGALREARDAWTKSEGEGHVDIAMCLYGEGRALRLAKKRAEAKEALGRALEIAERAMGRSFRGVAFVLVELGELALDEKRNEDARRLLREGVTTEARDQLDPLRLARARFALARAEAATGHEAEAAAELDAIRRVLDGTGERGRAFAARVTAWDEARPPARRQ